MNLTINGRQVTVDDSFRNLSREEQDATVEEIASKLPSDKKEASGVVAGLVHGGSEIVNGPAETLKRLAGVGEGRHDDPNYVPANVTNGSWNPANWNWSQLPQKVAEQAPAVVPDAAAGAAGAKLGKKVGGMKGAAVGGLAGAYLSGLFRTAGDTVKDVTVARTGDQNAESSTSDKAKGLATAAAAQLPAALLPTRFIPGLNPVRTVGAEGAKDAVAKALATAGIGGAGATASDAITQLGTTGTIDTARLPEAAVGGAATGAVLSTPKMSADVARAANNREFGGANKQATENYATRLADAGEGVGGLGNAKRDSKAQQMVKTDLKNELGDAAKEIRKGPQLSPDVDNALQRAQNDHTITPKDLALIESGTASSPHGANAAFLARTLRMAQLAQEKGNYSDKGWAGGVSGAIEGNLGYLLNPLRIVGGLGATAMGQHVLGMGNPKFALGVAGTYLGARMLDGMTGMRSPAKTFAEHFANQAAQLRLPTTPAPMPPPPPPGPAPRGPWNPAPPAPAYGPTGTVTGMQPAPGAGGPWGPRPLPTTSVPVHSAPAAPAPVQPGTVPWSPPQVTELPQFKTIALKMLAEKMKATNAENAAPPKPAEPELPQFNPIALNALKERFKENAALPAMQAKAEQEAAKAAQAKAREDQRVQTQTERAQAKAEAARVRAEKAEAAVKKAQDKEAAKAELAKAKAAAAEAKEAARLEAAKVKLATAALKAAAPKKVTKTNGKVKTEGEGDTVTPAPYEPLAEEHLYPKGITPQEYAQLEAAGKGTRSEVYMAKAEASERRRQGIASELKSKFPKSARAIDWLQRELQRVGTNPKEIARAVKHAQENVPDDVATAMEAFK